MLKAPGRARRRPGASSSFMMYKSVCLFSKFYRSGSTMR